MGFVATLAFALIHLAPGDPFAASFDDPQMTPAVRERMLAQFSYDQSLPVQYGRWLVNLARGELGWSHTLSRPVADVLKETVPNTLLLMLTGLGLGLVVGVALGTWQAVRRGTAAERVVDAMTLTFLSIPEFLLALAAVTLFTVRWRLFPVTGMVDPVWHDSLSMAGRVGDVLRHLVLPGLTLATATAAAVSRYHRTAMLAVLPEEFVRTARAKGAGAWTAVMRHALPNALGPAIAITGLLIPALFGGAVFIEKIFAWPGMGLTMVNAVGSRDYALVLAGVLCGSALVVIGGTVADVLHAWADPRVGTQA